MSTIRVVITSLFIVCLASTSNANEPTLNPQQSAELARHERTRCDLGKFDSCVSLGLLHYGNMLDDANPSEAYKLFEVACSNGHQRGCVTLGVLQQDNMEYAKARQSFELACQSGAGDGFACTLLAALIEKGLGGEKDYAAAIGLNRVGCAKGQPIACEAVDDITSALWDDCKDNVDKNPIPDSCRILERIDITVSLHWQAWSPRSSCLVSILCRNAWQVAAFQID